MRSRSSLVLALAVLAAAVAPACGNWSNDELEDLAFVDALPRPEELHLDSPGGDEVTQGLECTGPTCSQQQGLRACADGDQDLFCLGHGMVKNLNVLTHGLLRILDAIRQLPPTQRSLNGRVWGPHPDEEHPGRRWRVEVSRSSSGGGYSYAWSVQIAPPGGELVEIVAGAFLPGPGGSSRGTGSYSWDAATARDRGLDPDGDDSFDRLELRYDLVSDPRHIEAEISAANGAVLSIESDRHADRSGGWHYTLPLQIDGAGEPDLIEASARWQADRAGRADANITLGAGVPAPPGPYVTTTCWTAALERSYFDSDIEELCPPAGCPVGRATSCPFESLLP